MGVDENELSSTIENFLEAIGKKIRILGTPQVKMKTVAKEYNYDEVQTRYVVRLRSTDLVYLSVSHHWTSDQDKPSEVLKSLRLNKLTVKSKA